MPESKERGLKEKSARGGARAGAGRKPGSGAFGEKTIPMRVPVSLAEEIAKALGDLRESLAKEKEDGKGARPANGRRLALPAFGGKGFPKPESWGPIFDLGAEAVPNAASSCAVRACGEWAGEGILEGDWAIADRALPIEPGDWVAAAPRGEARIARVRREGGSWILHGADGRTLSQAESLDGLAAWGKVVSIVRRLP